MCGVVGVYYNSASCSVETVAAMRDLLHHRGPDDAGAFIEGPLGLGHRRLSIIDLSGGHQPMTTTGGRFTIVFNGEIYNYRELKRELEADGCRFETSSDTEVILKLHERIGDAATMKLNGIFAYAIWDNAAQRLFIARDRMGIKPLYYCAAPRGFAFASEIKALFESGLVDRRLNERRVAEYLTFRHVAGPDTLFAGIEVLPPGHTLQVVAGNVGAPKPYWSPREQRTPFAGSFRDAVDALDSELNRAIQRQMISDVPLGTFCSGGIDSSLTTAIAARHKTEQINTFSVGFDERDYDESAYAKLVATQYDTHHHELRIDERQYAEYLPKLVWHHDLPLNFANSVHIYALSRLARKHVTVVLTGEGADELFGGYPRYYIPRFARGFASLPGGIKNVLLSLLSLVPDHRARKLARVGRQEAPATLLFNNANSDRALVLEALRGAGPAPLEFREASLIDAATRGYDTFTAVALLDLQTYLVSILDRQDKMSMATSIEARVPFLDNEIVDLASSFPTAFKQTLRHRKRVLKEVALRYLPKEIVHRRKSGFGVPLKQWLAARGPMGELLDQTLRSECVGAVLDQKLLSRLVDEHRRSAADHSEFLWSVLNLGLWRTVFGV